MLNKKKFSYTVNKKNFKIQTIGIVGLGYVGLPLMLKFTNSKKYNVIGLDVNKIKLQKLSQGISYISSIKNSELINIKKNKIILSNEFKNIKKCDVVIYALPTPLTDNKDPDMSFIRDAILKSKNFFKKNQIIILESTVYPGATKDYFANELKKKFVIGKNFFLGYSPEREDPGNKKFNISNITKLVSGYSKKCLIKCENIYNSINIKTKRVSTIETAELTKLFENIFRSVNIGLVNEMKLICDKMGLNIYELIEAAKSKPFGFKAFYPGPGLGGHCIPIDPYLLTWRAKKYGLSTKFIELSADINNSMPNFVIDKINHSLNQNKKNFSNSKILVVGVAYKKNINDTRESPSVEIIEKLILNKSKIFYHDNYVKELEIKNNGNIINLKSIKISSKNLNKFDVVCIITDHDYIDYEMIKNNSKMIVDCRGRFKLAKNIVSA